MKLKIKNGGINDSQPDPYIIKANGKFYIYASGMGMPVKVYTAENPFGEWTRLPDVCYREGYGNFWAPSVIELDGKFYMYVSCMPNNSNDVHEQEMCVFVANAPEGPFEFVKNILPPFSIDSHIVKNQDGLFLFYSMNDYDSKMGGTHIVVDRMLDPYTPEGKPVKVITATLEQELWSRGRFSPDKDWYTIEGAFYFRKGDWHYLLYSGNCYADINYFVGYACAYTKENDLTKIKFKKYPADDVFQPLLSKNEWEEGTGHNSVIEIDDEYYAFYHGREWGNAEKGGEYRDARVCKLVVNGEKITAIRYKDKV